MIRISKGCVRHSEWTVTTALGAKILRRPAVHNVRIMKIRKTKSKNREFFTGA